MEFMRCSEAKRTHHFKHIFECSSMLKHFPGGLNPKLLHTAVRWLIYLLFRSDWALQEGSLYTCKLFKSSTCTGNVYREVEWPKNMMRLHCLDQNALNIKLHTIHGVGYCHIPYILIYWSEGHGLKFQQNSKCLNVNVLVLASYRQ